MESSVGILTTQIIARLRNFRFSSIEEANECILVELDKINRKPFQKREYSRSFVYLNEELPYLRSLPEFPYEFAEWKKAIKVKIRLPKLLQISGYTLYQFR